jgi:hypothetical protein
MNAEILATLEEAYPDHLTITDWMMVWFPRLKAVKDPEQQKALVAEALEEAAATGFVVEISFGPTSTGELGPTISFLPYKPVRVRKRPSAK